MKIKNIRDAVTELNAIVERESAMSALVDNLNYRIRALEERQGHLANRDRCHSLPFPQKLRDIGCVPPHERTAA